MLLGAVDKALAAREAAVAERELTAVPDELSAVADALARSPLALTVGGDHPGLAAIADIVSCCCLPPFSLAFALPVLACCVEGKGLREERLS